MTTTPAVRGGAGSPVARCRGSLGPTGLENVALVTVAVVLVVLAWLGLGPREFRLFEPPAHGPTSAPSSAGGPPAGASARTAAGGAGGAGAASAAPARAQRGGSGVTVDGALLGVVVSCAGLAFSVLVVRSRRRRRSRATAVDDGRVGGPESAGDEGDVGAGEEADERDVHDDTAAPSPSTDELAPEDPGAGSTGEPPLPTPVPASPSAPDDAAPLTPTGVSDGPGPSATGVPTGAGEPPLAATTAVVPRPPDHAPDEGLGAPRAHESSRVTLVDRRSARRVAVHQPGRLQWGSTDHDVVVIDVSESGAACLLTGLAAERELLPRAGGEVHLVAVLDGRLVDATASVQWVRPTGSDVTMGLHFARLSAETTANLRAVVRQGRL